MFYHHVEPDYKCSKCGAINRYFVRRFQYDQWKECADCGHNSKPPITTTSSGGTTYVVGEVQKYEEF